MKLAPCDNPHCNAIGTAIAPALAPMTERDGMLALLCCFAGAVRNASVHKDKYDTMRGSLIRALFESTELVSRAKIDGDERAEHAAHLAELMSVVVCGRPLGERLDAMVLLLAATVVDEHEREGLRAKLPDTMKRLEAALRSIVDQMAYDATPANVVAARARGKSGWEL